MKRTTNDTMKRTTVGRIVAGVALAAALVPGMAIAPSDAYGAQPQKTVLQASGDGEIGREVADAALSRLLAAEKGELSASQEDAGQEDDVSESEKVLAFDPEALAAIGTQESTGHTICCSSFSCAYADAVLDGTVHDHSYYTCSCCTWTDWGGGNSSFRSVGSDTELLREAYDQIASGRPTVIHVAAGYGEHWITLIGYTGVEDPDNLTLGNFIALDPWDGAQIIASERFGLYGDGCEHISER